MLNLEKWMMVAVFKFLLLTSVCSKCLQTRSAIHNLVRENLKVNNTPGFTLPETATLNDSKWFASNNKFFQEEQSGNPINRQDPETDANYPVSNYSTNTENQNYYSIRNDSQIENDTASEEEILRSIWKFVSPKIWTWALIVCHTLVFIIGIIGNIFVCIAVYRNYAMRTVTNYFIVNLAVADFLVILFCLIPSVVWDVTLTWFFGMVMCKIVLYLQGVSVTVSILTLTFISIDRWYAICCPLKFKSTIGRAKTAIGIIWVIALAYYIPEMIHITTKRTVTEVDTVLLTECAPAWSEETDTIFFILNMALFYVVPLLFISIAYLHIIRVLWKSDNALHHTIAGRASRESNSSIINMNPSTEGQLRSRRKAAKMLVVVIIMFASCYLPVHLLSILRKVGGLTNSEGNRAFMLISHWLCYANSAVNPIIYNFMSGKFRREFRSLFNKCGNDETSDSSRKSTYIYRYTTNHTNSYRSPTETVPLEIMHNKAVDNMSE